MSSSNKSVLPKALRRNTPAAGARVLLVSDNAQEGAKLGASLRRLEKPLLDVEHVTNVDEAKHAVERQDYDLILMCAEATMQGSTVALQHLQDGASDTPIVVIAQNDEAEFSEQMLSLGALDCVTLAALADQDLLRRVLRHAAARKAAQRQIARLQNFDSLTDLLNRDSLRDTLRRLVAKAAAEQSLVAVLMLNLDRFKLVNETLGPSRGDKLLQEVSNRLRACLADSDILARYNGDEFVAVSTGVGSPQEATLIAQKLLNALSRPMVIEGHEVYVTGSIGITVFPGDGEDSDVLLSNADAAVSRAKDLGRNHYQFYTLDMNAKTNRRLSLESELRRALDRGEFVLHYQPQFDLSQRRIAGFEALVRWEHPQLGLIPPNDFIPLAEETGLIAPLGEWVLGEACAQAKQWQAAGHRDLRMSVNLSSRQFFQENVLETVTRTLEKTNLAPASLELELTESAVMQDPDEATVTLCLLSNMGVRIAIDDFGTGHSSLNHLKRFPIDCLKIDRSFVTDVTVNTEDAAIVQAIIAMAHSLKLDVVAEGVETIEQLRFLEGYKCDMIQGYLVSRPLTAEQIGRTFLPNAGSRPEILPFGLAAAGALQSRG
jgi:diguanylate cyclase (GGDEF)-like protein